MHAPRDSMAEQSSLWKRAGKPLLIMWALTSLLSAGFPHVLAGGLAAIPFMALLGLIFTVVLGVPVVAILLLIDAFRRRGRGPIS